MPTNQENNSNVKDYLDIDNLQGGTNGVNSTFGKVNKYLGKGSDIAAIFNSDPVIGKTLGYFSNKASIIDAIDSGINGGYNGFMSSVAGTFSGASAGMLVARLFPQSKIVAGILGYIAGDAVGTFTKETFLNKEYRQLEFDPYDTQTHKFENGTWYKKSDNGSLTLIEDTTIIDNLNQGANERKNFNFYKNSTGEVVIEPKNPTFKEYYNIKTNGDIQTVTDNGLTITTKQTDGIMRVETYSSTEDTKKLTSLTVINPDGIYEYKNKVTGDYARNTTDEYLQNVKTPDGIKQIKIDKNSGKAIVKTFDGDSWHIEEYNSSSEVNKYIKDGGKFEYVDENSSVIKTTDGGKIVFHNNKDNEEKYVLDKDGNLKSYEIKNEKGAYQKYEGSSLDKMNEQEVQSISDALNDSTYNKTKIENAVNNIDKSNLKEKISSLENQKEQALIEFDNEHFKEIDAIHWQEVFAKAEELQLDEHHYSEDFNKLNSEIAKYNYEIHEENEELLEVDINDYLDIDTENSNTNFQFPASKNLWINNEFYERKVA